MQPAIAGLPTWQITTSRLHYQAGKTNIDVDALSRVSWPECIPDNLGTNIKVTATAVRAIQEAVLEKACLPHRGLQL